MKAKRISIQFSLSINYENNSFAYKYLYYNLYAVIFSKSLRKIKVTEKKKKNEFPSKSYSIVN